MIYLDQAATSFIKPEAVKECMFQAMGECASYGRAGHRLSLRAAEIVYETRRTAALLFGTTADRVVFTSSATHGLNMAIRTLVSRGDRVVVSGFEHNAVMRPLYAIGAEVIVAGKTLFDYDSTLADFKRKFTLKPKAVICTHVSNVFGYVLPIQEIATACFENDIPLIIDASQSAGILPISLSETHAAFIAMPGHKSLYGPQGTGILLCGMDPKPIFYGGTGSLSLEYSMPDFLPDLAEAGTHNLPGIAGLMAGMKFVQSTGLIQILNHENQLKHRFIQNLKGNYGIKIVSEDGNNQIGVVSWYSKDIDCEEIASRLSDCDIAVRAGLHCAPLAHQSAGTLDHGTVRVSFSWFNTLDDVDRCCQIIEDIF